MRRNLAEVMNSSNDPLTVSTSIVNACSDAKAKDIKVFNASKVSSNLFSYFIIASGHSDRQVQGITNKIIDTLAENGIKPVAVEGLDIGHWVIMDFADVMVHIFYEPIRSRYDLESLWSRASKLEIRKKPRSQSLVLKPAKSKK